MIEARPRKGGGVGMTAIALFGGGNVIVRHHRGNDALTFAVAARTVARRALEYAAHMAGSAFGNTVRAKQRKPGFHVGEVMRHGLRGGIEQVGANAHRENSREHADKNSSPALGDKFDIQFRQFYFSRKQKTARQTNGGAIGSKV